MCTTRPPAKSFAPVTPIQPLLVGNTDAALAAGVFGVPTLACGGRLFWGQDALPMLRAYLEGDAWFDGPDWDAAARLPVGVSRR